MSKVRVGVVGYGVIGQRLTDGVTRQKDMNLVGIANVAPTLSIRTYEIIISSFKIPLDRELFMSWRKGKKMLLFL